MQSRGDGVGSESNRHKPSCNGWKPCGGLSCTGCLWPGRRPPIRNRGFAFAKQTTRSIAIGEIPEPRLCIFKTRRCRALFARLSLLTVPIFIVTRCRSSNPRDPSAGAPIFAAPVTLSALRYRWFLRRTRAAARHKRSLGRSAWSGSRASSGTLARNESQRQPFAALGPG